MNLRLFLGSAITAIAAIFVAPHASAQTQSADGAATGAVLASTDTRIGRLEFERGYPSQPTVKTLFDQMDFQRATQAYLWSLPPARLSRPSNRLPVNKRSVTALSKRAAGARPPQRGR